MSQFCSKCGTKNLDEASFCKSCGFNLKEAAAKLQKEKAAQAPKPKIDDHNPTQNKQSEIDQFFNGSKYKEESKDEQDREKLAKELRDKIDARNKYSETDGDPTNPWNGFLLIIGILLGIFLISKSMSVSNNTTSETSLEAEWEANQADKSSPTLQTVGSESSTNEDVEYYNKSKALWNDKRGEYKDPKKALEYLTKAIEINPNDPVYYNDRGIIYDQIKQYKNATKNYDKAIMLNSKDGVFYQNRGYNYWNRNLINKAQDDAQKACKLGQCELKKDLSESKLEEKNESALKYYNQAIEFSDHQNGGYSNPNEAIRLLTQAIKLNPKEAIFYRARGIAYYQLKDNENALFDADKACQLGECQLKNDLRRRE